MVVDSGSSSSSFSSSWSWEQEKAFENSLAVHSEDLSNRWEKIAQDVPGKTIDRIKHHYQLLLEDLNDIESGQVPLPTYAFTEEGGGGSSKRGESSTHSHADSGHGGKGVKVRPRKAKRNCLDRG